MDEKYMAQALCLAEAAAREGEPPVGCVLVDETGTVVGRGYNSREREQSALAHAELAAIDEACRTLGRWRLNGCTIYVTLEPCPMCAGAILNARVSRVVYGAKEPASGACGSVLNLFLEYGSAAQIVGGVMEAACAEVMRSFFQRRRYGDAPEAR